MVLARRVSVHDAAQLQSVLVLNMIRLVDHDEAKPSRLSCGNAEDAVPAIGQQLTARRTRLGHNGSLRPTDWPCLTCRLRPRRVTMLLKEAGGPALPVWCSTAQ